MSRMMASDPWFEPAESSDGLALFFVAERDADAARLAALGLDGAAVTWLAASEFRGERGRVVLLPGSGGALAGAVVGLGRVAGPDEGVYAASLALGDRLPEGRYRFAQDLSPLAATRAALGFAIGRYRFLRYRRPVPGPGPTLAWPRGADRATVRRAHAADTLARDLINTPAEDLGPDALAAAIASVADRYGASVQQVVGDDLPRQGYPAVHAVGRAGPRAPRLIDLRHGDEGPRVTLVGKGVCFDTGGLDLKPASAMALMKKDMGGAACALALAQMLLDARVPVRLRLLVPAVENSVAGNAFRPGDVLETRRGLTVEVGNTDAEGRLVLADALAAAEEDGPELLIDFATLTGAARVALGPELPALFSTREALTAELLQHAALTEDPLWPLPLWDGYDDEFGSKVADLGNVASHGLAGAIVGALFLRRFVAAERAWLHLDLYAWNGRERPGRPAGAEMQTVRALYSLLVSRYGLG